MICCIEIASLEPISTTCRNNITASRPEPVGKSVSTRRLIREMEDVASGDVSEGADRAECHDNRSVGMFSESHTRLKQDVGTCLWA